MENKLLWEIQSIYLDEFNKRLNKVKYNDTTIKELLDLGFNCNYLITEKGKVWLGWKNKDNTYERILTKEQLNVKITMKEDYGYYEDECTDSDGYVIAKVYCVNREDENLFEEVI